LPAENSDPLNKMFYPKSVAIVGASATNQESGWLPRLIKAGYSGTLYPVNPKATEIMGLKAYPSVKDIPEPVDYAIFNIPRRFAPAVMSDCVANGVKVAHVYTAGFSETGEEEGKQLEAQLLEIAREGNIHVLGPNCMGIYCPSSGLTFNEDFPTQSGKVAFVSQSGAESIRFVFLSQDVGIHFSKVISYGNAIDLDAPDFLDYLAEDDETEVVACYIEGSRNGRKFMDAIKRCLTKKPLIVLKAGLTESGAGAAASHTASLAGSLAIWDAFFKQTGAIRVNTMDEVTDIIQTLLNLRCPQGRRVALVGRGGGIGVIASDICERAGLKVPAFHPDTRKKLAEVIPEAGAGMRNPVETTYGMGGAADFYIRGLKIVDSDPETDLILIHMAVDVYGGHSDTLHVQVTQAAEVLAKEAKHIKKPMAVALFTGGNVDIVRAVNEARELLIGNDIPVYSGVEAATKAINKLITYHELAQRD